MTDNKTNKMRKYSSNNTFANSTHCFLDGNSGCWQNKISSNTKYESLAKFYPAKFVYTLLNADQATTAGFITISAFHTESLIL